MIIGVGHDICDQRRIEKSVTRFGDKFVSKICDAKECLEYGARKKNSQKKAISYLAGRFAAKESVYKALAAGDQQQMSWHHAQIVSLPSGAPQLSIKGPCLKAAEKFIPEGGALSCFVSISDEPPYSSAVVILSYHYSELLSQ